MFQQRVDRISVLIVLLLWLAITRIMVREMIRGWWRKLRLQFQWQGQQQQLRKQALQPQISPR